LYPVAVVKALGYDFDNLLANKTLLYQRIVEAGAMLSKFLVPNIMDLTKRHQFMCANIYADSTHVKSQHYIFKLNHIYGIAGTDTKTRLDVIDLTVHQFKTVDQVWKIFYDAIKELMNWDTGYTILGYLERAYEGDSFLLPAPVIQEGILNPVYNEEILLQIHNATVVSIDPDSLKVTQDPARENVLLSAPKFVEAEAISILPCCPTSALLSIPSDHNPTESEVIIATRLTTTVKTVGDGSKEVTCGTEILSSIEVYDAPNGLPNGIPTTTAFFIVPENDDDSAAFEANIAKLTWYFSCLSAFDRHPHIIYRWANSPVVRLHSNIDNFTEVDTETLGNLHRMCIYSEFNCF
jgi:hypothetical protein